MSDRPATEIQKAPPLTVGESNFLAGEGTIDAAQAGGGIRFVYCECEGIRSDDWYSHIQEHSDHEPYAIERVQAWGIDPLLFFDESEEPR